MKNAIIAVYISMMRKVTYIAFSFILCTTFTACKTAPQEADFLRNNVVHGINDQIITGKFVAKNDLNIQHEINITKLNRSKNYEVNFAAYDKNGIAYYSVTSKGTYNGYVLVVPFEYEHQKDDLYLNFNGEKMKINYDTDVKSIISNLGIKGNHLPKIYTHILTAVPENRKKPELFFLKNFENEYPKEAGLFNHPIIKNRLEKLLKDTYPDFIKNFREEAPIVQAEPGVYKTSGCSDRKCLDIQSFIEFNVPHNKINVKIFNKKKKIEYKEP
ncbi:hypothetical protein CMT72_10540 [Elizabethkingia anophelis]|nr:hypothetical protein [Elizabethkingia anophelis]